MKQIVYLLFILLVSSNENGSVSKIRPTKLTCEYMKNPSVVDVLNPRLGWINITDEEEYNQSQTAYQIKVATTKTKLSHPDLWDSGKVVSDQSIRIPYNGKKLKSRQDCWWTLRTWDNEGNVSGWTIPSYWKMGILELDDWKADWIGAPWQGEEALPIPEGGRSAALKNYGPPAPLMRKEFFVSKKIVKAEAFVTGLGYFEFYVNGQKVGDDVLIPNQTNYSKRPNLPNRFLPLEDNFKGYKVMYLHYDITNKLKEGRNVIGSILGNGFYNPAKDWAEGYGSPRFLGQIYLTYSDGSEEVIVSDESWKAFKGPILMDMVYYGEHYDARLEQKDWSTVEFNSEKWENVKIRKAPTGRLVAHTAYTDRITEKIEPKSIKRLDNGNYFVDFGVEISGWVRIKNVKATRGHKINMQFNSSDFSGENTYIFNGDLLKSYAPRFNWFVFNSVEIVNWPGELDASQLIAEAVNTKINVTSNFESSNQLFNDLNKIWQRTQLDNMHGGVVSDCPHRERSAYTGDGQVTCSMVMHNFDARNFYYKWVQDILEAQNSQTGYVPNSAPWQPGSGGGIAWGAAIAEIPWEFYVHYGAVDMLQDNYKGIKDYIKYMQQWLNNEGIIFSQRPGSNGEPLEWFNLGDWVAPGELPSTKLVHTFYFWRCTSIAAKISQILGKKEEEKLYRQLSEKTKIAFHNYFYDNDKGTYGNFGQNIFALKMGIPKKQEKNVIAALKENIKNNKGHLDTGIFGTRFLFETLSDYGMNTLAYEILNKKTYPSFGYWVSQGTSTTWEQWNGDNSRNHPMFGGGLVWMYRKLAGMSADYNEPGYKHIIFKPNFIEDVDYVIYSNETPYGKAGIEWKQKLGEKEIKIMVPVTSKATIYLPISDASKVLTGSGLPIGEMKEISTVSIDNGELKITVGSGIYEFKF